MGAIDGGADAIRTWAEALSASGLTTEFIAQHEVRKKVFFKTILNSALNALCASSGITMRQAMQLRHTRAMAGMLIREGLSVGSAVGYNYGEDAQEVCIAYLDGGGDHLPSMWVDLERKNRTEIEYMNGKIVKIGRMFKNIDVDVNIFFTSMIVTLEIKAGARGPDEIPDYLVH
jgi:2-dehydropantoate 2-reductase